MGWEERYQAKLASPEEALQLLRPGMRIFLGTGCGEPQSLVDALVAGPIEDAEIFHLLSLGKAPYARPEFRGRFRHNSFFIGPAVRAAVQEGRADYTPIALSDIPRLIESGRVTIDAALVCVSPPDEHGYVSLGVSVDIVHTALRHAGVVIAEVNGTMPRTLGDSVVPCDRFDRFVEADRAILEYEAPEASEVQLQVARNVAHLVEDGATLEMGIGVIPSAVLRFLEARRDLGVHTEVMTDAVVDLVEAGVITNARKTLHPGKTVTAFCMGTRRLYDFVHNNPGVEFHPTAYVNDPFVISRHDRMTAINVALEVDITGQVAADSIGHRFYSGIGGQADFIRGAGKARGGRPIICLPSLTSDGSRSRIVPALGEGAGVVTPRGDVHYVVTEHGIAYLHGKSISERVVRMIQIAHPRHREELLEYARRHRYVDAEQAMPPPGGQPYPADLEAWVELRDQRRAFVRPLKASDEDSLKEFFYSLRDQSLFTRFFTARPKLARERKEPIRNLDYDLHFALGAFTGRPDRDEVIGVAHYILDPAANLANLAFLVRDDRQHQGLGTLLFRRLADAARARGIRGFTADVLAHNRAVLRILQDSGYLMHSHLEDGVYAIVLRFDAAPPACTPSRPG